MDPERVQELDAWLAKTDEAYAGEPTDQSTQLWKADWSDDLQSIIDRAWRFCIPLLAGNIIGRLGCSMDKVWEVLREEPWAFTSWLNIVFDIGNVFTGYHCTFGFVIVLVWGQKCFSMPRIGNGLWAYWIMLCASVLIFFMERSYRFLDYIPMILILASLGYLGVMLHWVRQGKTNVLRGVEYLHKALVALYEPKYEEPESSPAF